jgi:8-oxo-dGTP pyrophosphatase MutT (NUDIX family)
MKMPLTLDHITRRLTGHLPTLLPPDNGTLAAVAFILRDTVHGPEGLFIERATRDSDPWSGNVGFPGGRVEPEDGSLRETAERETREEIGLDLSRKVHLGRLSDIAGAHLPVRVACFVNLVTGEPPLLLSDEVKEAFWVPLAALTAPERRITARIMFRDRNITTPAIILPQPDKPLLWGITYRLVSEFLEIVGEETFVPSLDGTGLRGG